MKTKKRRICILLIGVLLLALCPQVLADSIDPMKDASLTIDMGYDGVPLEGVKFDIYFLASVDKDTSFTVAKDFTQYPVKLEDNTAESWNELAVALKGYAQKDTIQPLYSTTTNADGEIYMDGLNTGLYLVVGEKLAEGDYTYIIQPTIVCLPSLDKTGDNSYKWNYDVTISPKSDREDKPADETVTRKVLKVWDDNKNTDMRPEDITVQLLCDGNVYDTVKLTAEENWKYTWDNLPACDENGIMHEWCVVENSVEGYTVKVEQSGLTFVITNSKTTPDTPDNPDKPNIPEKLPQTGLLWWPVPALVVAGLLFIIVGILRRRKCN